MQPEAPLHSLQQCMGAGMYSVSSSITGSKQNTLAREPAVKDITKTSVSFLNHLFITYHDSEEVRRKERDALE